LWPRAKGWQGRRTREEVRKRYKPDKGKRVGTLKPGGRNDPVKFELVHKLVHGEEKRWKRPGSLGRAG